MFIFFPIQFSQSETSKLLGIYILQTRSLTTELRPSDVSATDGLQQLSVPSLEQRHRQGAWTIDPVGF